MVREPFSSPVFSVLLGMEAVDPDSCRFGSGRRFPFRQR